MTISIPQADIAALTKAIQSVPQAQAAGASEFCRLWTQVKPILEALVPVVTVIPVVGAIISGALATLLALGSAAHGAMCGGR
jgi:hypothetical protein